LTTKYTVHENSPLMKRLHQLEDLADKLKIRINFYGRVSLVDEKTGKEYAFLDVESEESFWTPQFITSFPPGTEYKLTREE